MWKLRYYDFGDALCFKYYAFGFQMGPYDSICAHTKTNIAYVAQAHLPPHPPRHQGMS